MASFEKIRLTSDAGYIAWDGDIDRCRVELGLGDRQFRLSSFREESDAIAIFEAGLFLLGRPRANPDVSPTNPARTKVRVKPAAIYRNANRHRNPMPSPR